MSIAQPKVFEHQSLSKTVFTFIITIGIAALALTRTAIAEESFKPHSNKNLVTENSVTVKAAPSKEYHLSMQLWQDQSLITAPKFKMPGNEQVEFTVRDPDDARISITVQPQKGSRNKIVVDTNIFLSQSGTWEAVGSPRLITKTGRHASVEINVQGQGFTHSDGRPVEALRFSVLVKDTK